MEEKGDLEYKVRKILLTKTHLEMKTGDEIFSRSIVQEILWKQTNIPTFKKVICLICTYLLIYRDSIDFRHLVRNPVMSFQFSICSLDSLSSSSSSFSSPSPLSLLLRMTHWFLSTIRRRKVISLMILIMLKMRKMKTFYIKSKYLRIKDC